MSHAIAQPPVVTGATLNIHGMDDETKAVLGYLARYTGRTLGNYELDLKMFRRWMPTVGLTRILDAERWQLELWVRSMTEAGYAPSTVSRRFGAVRGFFHFAHVDGLIAKDPSAYVRTPKVETELQYRTYFESVDMALVLRHATAPLDRAVLTLMFDLALRVGELCGLDVSSIVRAGNGTFLRFIGKGGKPAELLIPPASLRAIETYLAGRDIGPLFLTRYGNRMNRPAVQRIITRVSRAAGVTQHVTPHGIRRTHARFATQQGKPITAVAKNLRHKDARVTATCYAIDTGMDDIGRSEVSALMANLAR